MCEGITLAVEEISSSPVMSVMSVSCVAGRYVKDSAQVKAASTGVDLYCTSTRTDVLRIETFLTAPACDDCGHESRRHPQIKRRERMHALSGVA